jgi:hypothetical protein
MLIKNFIIVNKIYRQKRVMTAFWDIDLASKPVNSVQYEAAMRPLHNFRAPSAKPFHFIKV